MKHDLYRLLKEYKLALWQCYERYLLTFGDVNVEEISDVDTFRETFFPEGFDAENAGLTVKSVHSIKKLFRFEVCFFRLLANPTLLVMRKFVAFSSVIVNYNCS